MLNRLVWSFSNRLDSFIARSLVRRSNRPSCCCCCGSSRIPTIDTGGNDFLFSQGPSTSNLRLLFLLLLLLLSFFLSFFPSTLQNTFRRTVGSILREGDNVHRGKIDETFSNVHPTVQRDPTRGAFRYKPCCRSYLVLLSGSFDFISVQFVQTFYITSVRSSVIIWRASCNISNATSVTDCR